ncbi:hypothetical protein XNC3_2190012 [Xenorhabdus nematophila F1]|nr:hypothetical protein XNC3_2190012 [Xenorhabdus nematophila F1]
MDAEAICEAAPRPSMRFVQPRTEGATSYARPASGQGITGQRQG